ncbi:MAG TPA: hypothetical protein PKK06_12495 [Phycisphaerae bacterium]|nr:hypothetical protein [Phycisphaerae bacterium]HNU46447.1 hypothetical protein [Phycisphaerae bacterium]
MKLDLMRDLSKEMPEVPNPKAVEHLRIWNCSYRSLAPLRAFTRLRTLQILSFRGDSFDVLRKMTRLKYLQVVHLPHVKDLSPLADLTALEALELSTAPGWDPSKVSVVKSLAPLARLPKLRHLELYGVRPKSKSLRALQACPQLQTARISKYPKAEIARFYEATGISDDYIQIADYGAL